jgi:alpha-D-xyloside xylohydrolase
LEEVPLFIRAGAILPLGPDKEYATEKPEDPIELRIYPGANSSFVLYEDENDNYNYEKGLHATIQFTWDDVSRALTIGQRSGNFPGLRNDRTFNVVLVRPGHGAGMSTTLQPDKVVSYSGNPETVHMGRTESKSDR